MVNLEQLTRRGRRAYELGRARWAARIALVVVPMTVVCAVETGAHGMSACLGAVLLAAAGALRFKNRAGAEDATTGIVAGCGLLLGAFLLRRLGIECGSTACIVLAGGGGAVAGAFVACRCVSAEARRIRAVVAAGVACLAASVGCVAIGSGGIVAMVAGLAVGVLVTSKCVPKPAT